MAVDIARERRRLELNAPAERKEETQQQAPAAARPDVTPEVSAHRWWILLGLIMAAALEILDTTVVNVALPQMSGNLGATTDEIAWVSTGYILSNVIVLPMTAWLSGRFGRKRYLMASILIFNIARFMCGVSGSLTEIIFWRLVQGAGGAALISTAQSTLVEIFPRSQLPTVQSIFGLGLIVTPTIGPALGGYLTDNYSWHMIFFIHIPLGIASLALVGLFLQDSKHQKRVNTVDFPGILMLAAGMGSLQYVLEEGERYDWFDDAWITRLAITAFVSLVGFVWWELTPRNKAPILDLRVLRDRGLAGSVLLGLVLGFGLYGGVFIYPLFVQNILGFSPTTTGLALIPGGLLTAAAVILCGRLLQRGFDARVLIIVGMFIYMGAMWLLGHLTTQSGQADTQLGLMVRGFGLGLVFIPIQTVAFAGLARGADRAGVCFVQPDASARRLVRHRRLEHLHHKHDSVPPGGYCFQSLQRQLHLPGSPERSRRSIDGRRLQRGGGTDRGAACSESDRSGAGVGHGLQQCVYSARHHVSHRYACGSAPAEAPPRRGPAGGGALGHLTPSRSSPIRSNAAGIPSPSDTQ